MPELSMSVRLCLKPGLSVMLCRGNILASTSNIALSMLGTRLWTSLPHSYKQSGRN